MHGGLLWSCIVASRSRREQCTEPKTQSVSVVHKPSSLKARQPTAGLASNAARADRIDTRVAFTATYEPEAHEVVSVSLFTQSTAVKNCRRR